MSSDWRVPLTALDYGPEEEQAVLRVLRSGWLSMGPEVEAFEREFAAAIGVHHAIAVANGTAALHLACCALDLGPGDEVIQPAINFVAAANMTVAVGATPLFADICAQAEPTLDPAAIERLVTPRTKAVVAMHYGGAFCRMAEIHSLCRRRGLALIEDACHAVGARYLDPQQSPPHGRAAGTLGDLAAFSFFSNKNLAVGEGGMVTTDRDDLAQRVRQLRSHGMTTLTWDRHRGHANTYDVLQHGYNYRLDELRAALGRVQLAKLAANNQRRGALVRRYRQSLDGLPGWTVAHARTSGDSAHHLMAVVAPDADTRERAVTALRDARIQSSMHYPCIPDFAAFRAMRAGELPNSRAFAARVITLPLFPAMSAPEVDDVCGVIRRAAAR
ncbi:MAG: DegT/DnrJ/EryC1/StrS family aminotransferase [Verrucomicrobia bacterium]|nr:DegT/DnrJ/EryC1/StrS family aminotransferase [Verrucomicrobiota bacterium]